MARALPSGRKGRAWGNALGGFRFQRRDARGRFTSGGAGSPTKPPSARAQKRYQKKMAKQDKRDADALLRSMNPPSRNRRKMRKDKSTSLLNPRNRSQQQFKTGALSRQAGFVPYTRHGFANQSVGFNAGARVLPNYRISGGVYLKVTNIDKTKREKAIRRADEEFMNDTARKLSPAPILDGTVKGGLVNFRRKSIDRLFGGEKRVTDKTYARLGTDQNAMPTLVVEYNRKDPRTKRRKRNQKARRKAQWQYNDMVTRSRGSQAKSPRPQRRGK